MMVLDLVQSIWRVLHGVQFLHEMLHIETFSNDERFEQAGVGALDEQSPQLSNYCFAIRRNGRCLVECVDMRRR